MTALSLGISHMNGVIHRGISKKHSKDIRDHGYKILARHSWSYTRNNAQRGNPADVLQSPLT